MGADNHTPTDAWFIDEYIHQKSPINRAEQIARDGETKVELTDDCSFIVEFNGATRMKFRVKKGYRFDGASIPKIFQWLIGPPLGGSYEAAALAHDMLCESKKLDAWGAGLAFYYLMRSTGVAWWRMRYMWKAVRRFCQPIQDRYPAAVTAFALEHLEVSIP